MSSAASPCGGAEGPGSDSTSKGPGLMTGDGIEASGGRRGMIPPCPLRLPLSSTEFQVAGDLGIAEVMAVEAKTRQISPYTSLVFQKAHSLAR